MKAPVTDNARKPEVSQKCGHQFWRSTIPAHVHGTYSKYPARMKIVYMRKMRKKIAERTKPNLRVRGIDNRIDDMICHPGIACVRKGVQEFGSG